VLLPGFGEICEHRSPALGSGRRLPSAFSALSILLPAPASSPRPSDARQSRIFQRGGRGEARRTRRTPRNRPVAPTSPAPGRRRSPADGFPP